MNHATLLPFPPQGYRLMDVGEKPTGDDIVWSINSDPKWSRSTMSGTWSIPSVPSPESLVYARMIQ